MATQTRGPSLFGQQLRHWRRRRGLSQADLAYEAETTPRYVSFIETGRSRPGRDIILRLAEAMDIPIRERNALLAAAGLPHAYGETELDDAAMRPVNMIIDKVLRGHDPFPAWGVRRGYRFFAANDAANRLFPGIVGAPPERMLDMWFAPGPFREMVENWQDVIWTGVAALRREALVYGDPVTAGLLERAEAHLQDVPRPGPSATPDLPVVCPRFRVGDKVIRTISTVMRFDTAIDITAAELRVELLFPADEDSEAFFRAQAQ